MLLCPKCSANPITVASIWKQIPFRQLPFANNAKPHSCCRAFWAIIHHLQICLKEAFCHNKLTTKQRSNLTCEDCIVWLITLHTNKYT